MCVHNVGLIIIIIATVFLCNRMKTCLYATNKVVKGWHSSQTELWQQSKFKSQVKWQQQKWLIKLQWLCRSRVNLLDECHNQYLYSIRKYTRFKHYFVYFNMFYGQQSTFWWKSRVKGYFHLDQFCISEYRVYWSGLYYSKHAYIHLWV